jgi:chemotaxis protein methyltransferase CheR
MDATGVNRLEEYIEFTRGFYEYTGIDLQSYKRPQMERRLTSLRNQHGYADFRQFLMAVKQDERLLHAVLDKMTINVSEFLRNKERWEALIPHLQSLSQNGTLAAWSAACSTGEEPYTLAMLMEEHVRRPYSILATDIDKRVLQQAQCGVYNAYQMKSVPDAYVRKYFSGAADGTWSVSPVLKKHVTFRYHNLLADPYPNSLDLIICRNVLIYFTDDAKQRVVNGFTRALRPGGILFVGSTEQFLHDGANGLVNVAPFLYQRKDA